jgi:chromosome segregation ATPase
MTVAPALLALSSAPLLAQQPTPAEAKLRETLRTTMLELRAAQTDKANLQAAQATLETANKTLTTEAEAMKKKFDALTAQAAADQASARKEIDDLTGRLADREAELTKHREALEKWKIAHQQVAAVANKKEEARAAAVQKGIELERTVAAQQKRNVELYKLADEILTRYSKFGLGEAIAAREPFTSLTRVKLQNIAEDYKDKLLDNVIKPKP